MTALLSQRRTKKHLRSTSFGNAVSCLTRLRSPSCTPSDKKRTWTVLSTKPIPPSSRIRHTRKTKFDLHFQDSHHFKRARRWFWRLLRISMAWHGIIQHWHHVLRARHDFLHRIHSITYVHINSNDIFSFAKSTLLTLVTSATWYLFCSAKAMPLH